MGFWDWLFGRKRPSADTSREFYATVRDNPRRKRRGKKKSRGVRNNPYLSCDDPSFGGPSKLQPYMVDGKPTQLALNVTRGRLRGAWSVVGCGTGRDAKRAYGKRGRVRTYALHPINEKLELVPGAKIRYAPKGLVSLKRRQIEKEARKAAVREKRLANLAKARAASVAARRAKAEAKRQASAAAAAEAEAKRQARLAEREVEAQARRGVAGDAASIRRQIVEARANFQRKTIAPLQRRLAMIKIDRPGGEAKAQVVRTEIVKQKARFEKTTIARLQARLAELDLVEQDIVRNNPRRRSRSNPWPWERESQISVNYGR